MNFFSKFTELKVFLEYVTYITWKLSSFCVDLEGISSVSIFCFFENQNWKWKAKIFFFPFLCKTLLLFLYHGVTEESEGKKTCGTRVLPSACCQKFFWGKWSISMESPTHSEYEMEPPFLSLFFIFFLIAQFFKNEFFFWDSFLKAIWS